MFSLLLLILYRNTLHDIKTRKPSTNMCKLHDPQGRSSKAGQNGQIVLIYILFKNPLKYALY